MKKCNSKKQKSKKQKSDTCIILIISAVIILLTGLMIAENLPVLMWQIEDAEIRPVRWMAGVSKNIALEVAPKPASAPESDSEPEPAPESQKPDIQKVYAMFSQYNYFNDGIFSDFIPPSSASLDQEIHEYKDQVKGDFEPVSYEGNLIPQELVMKAQEGIYYKGFTYMALDDLGTDDYRMDLDEMYRFFPELDKYRDEIRTEQDAYLLAAGTKAASGIYTNIDAAEYLSIYHFAKDASRQYYVFVYRESENDRLTKNVQVTRRIGDEFVKVDEFKVQTSIDSGRVIKYKNNYYYVYLYDNDALSSCTDGIGIHKLGADAAQESILIRYLPETYAWKNMYCRETIDEAFLEQVKEYLDSIKPELTSDQYLEKGQDKEPGIYFGDEVQVQDLTGENDKTYYAVDINIGVPIYMIKNSAWGKYGRYIDTEFYLPDVSQDTLIKLEELGSYGEWNPLMQVWFKEIDGKKLIFCVDQNYDYAYIMYIWLIEEGDCRVIRSDFFVPEKSRFVLTEDEKQYQISQAEQMYNEFIDGERSADEWDILKIATPTGEPDRRYFTSYTMADVTGDGIPELHIKSGDKYIIFSVKNGEMYTLAYKEPVALEQYNPLAGGGTLTCTGEWNGLGCYYIYYEYNASGEHINELFFSWIDQDKDHRYSENDEYTYDGTVYSYEEWYALTRKYLYTDAGGTEQVRNAAEWTVYCLDE